MSSKDVARLTGEGASVVWSNTQDLPVLELDDIKSEGETALVARGAAYAREYVRIEHATTVLLQNIAVVIVALRQQHDDLRGQSHEYRQVVAEMYRRAGIPADSAGRIQANIRYHVGNKLRRFCTPRELKRAGLLPESPLERQQDVKATQAAIVRATQTSASAEQVPGQATKRTWKSKSAKGEAKDVPAIGTPAAGTRVKATADHLRLAEVASNLVGQLREDVIDVDMTDGQVAKLEEHLAAIENAARRLRRHIKNRRSDA